MELKTYSVYELRPDMGKHFIGSVEAGSMDSAIEHAQNQYGAPIKVVPA